MEKKLTFMRLFSMLNSTSGTQREGRGGETGARGEGVLFPALQR